MKLQKFFTAAIGFLFVSSNCLANMWAEGIPIAVQKTDWSNLHLLFIQLDKPLASSGCTRSDGLVFLDSNESSKAALSFALAAFASGKKFRCYVVANQCSAITGVVDTYPICSTYPTILN